MMSDSSGSWRPRLRKRAGRISILLAAALVASTLTIQKAPQAVVRADPSDIAIDDTSFPDSQFRKYVSENIDVDGNGYLSEDERAITDPYDGRYYNAIDIQVEDWHISDFTGLELFPNLVRLNVRRNEMTILDLSGNPNLEELYFDESPVEDLNISNCSKLREISGENNNLSSIDVSGCPDLERLVLNWNQQPLGSLNLTGNTKLRDVQVAGTGLDELNVSGLTELEYLNCEENQIDDLDLGACTKLRSLNARCNALTVLDVSDKKELFELFVEDNPDLVILIVSGCTRLEHIECFRCSLDVLDFAGLSRLTDVLCFMNGATTIDLSGCYVLSHAMLMNNDLGTIDISDCAMLADAYYLGNSHTFPDEVTVYGEFNVDPGTGDLVDFNRGLMVDDSATIVYNGGAPIEIDDTFFPDDNFRQFILDDVDINHDGYLNDVERGVYVPEDYYDCYNALDMHIEDRGIEDLTGIELFPNLHVLNVERNPLTTLDFTSNLELEDLDFDECPVTDVDVSACSKLIRLSGEGCAFTTIDVAGCPDLEILSIGWGAPLDALDVSQNPNLRELYVGHAGLDALDIENNDKLEILYCEENQLDALNLSYNYDLKELCCNDNQIGVLNLDSNSELERLYCAGNPIKELDVQCCPNLMDLDAGEMDLDVDLDLHDMKNLNFVQVPRNPNLGAIDVSGCDNLLVLDCAQCNINALDVTDLSNLLMLSCFGNNMEYLYWSGCHSLTRAWVMNNLLDEVDLDETPFLANAYLNGDHHTFPDNVTVYGDFDLSDDQSEVKDLRSGLMVDDSSEIHIIAPSPIEINDWNFPDDAFRQYLSDNLDIDHDGYLDDYERGYRLDKNVNTYDNALDMQLEDMGIEDLAGIEFFPNLQVLNVGLNPLTTLDLSSNSELKDLDFDECPVNNHNLLNCLKLVRLSAEKCDFDYIDVSRFENLEILSIGWGRRINDLNVSNNPKLRELYVGGMGLHELDLWNNQNLERLFCEENDLEHLWLDNNPNLVDLFCGGNQLQELYLSQNVNLVQLNCAGNPLWNLDVRNCAELVYLEAPDTNLNDLDVGGLDKLVELYVFNNHEMRNLNVAGCSNLEVLECFESNINGLDVSGLTKLTNLECFRCDLEWLNLTGCDSLEVLDCFECRIRELDLSGLSNLKELSCHRNGMETLDLTGCTALVRAYVMNNNIAMVSLMDCPNLLEDYLNGDNYTFPDEVTIYGEFTISDSGMALEDFQHGIMVDDRTYVKTAENNIAVDSTNFPDDAFRQYIADNLDVDGDGYLDEYERGIAVSNDGRYYNAFDMEAENLGIADLTGIEFFPNLRRLNARRNNMTSVDLSGNTQLEELSLDECPIDTLDISTCTKLRRFYAEGCNFTSISVTHCPDLESMNLSRGGALGSIDLSQNPNLRELWLFGAGLTELDVSNNPLLEKLDCGDNALTVLNVSSNVNLEELRCYSNPIAELNVQSCTKLWHLEAPDMELTELDVSGMTELKELRVDNNRDLANLNIDGCDNLEVLECFHCALTNLDLSGYANLKKLVAFGNDMETLNLEGCTALEIVDLKHNKLAEIDVTDSPILIDAYDNGDTDSFPNRVVVYGEYELQPDNSGVKEITKGLIVDDETQIITVKPTYTITVTKNGEGTATASIDSGIKGTEVTLTATAAEGYQFKEWQVISGGVVITDNKFVIGTADVEINAIFEGIPRTITVTNDGNGTATASVDTGVKGEEVTLTATPNDGYIFKEWQVISGGVTITNNKFTVGTADVEIAAYFEAITRTITVTNDGNGTASADAASGIIGDSITLTATPNAGYQFKEWQVISGGVTIEGNAFAIGTADVEIKAIFEAIPRTITVTNDGNGAATASVDTGVKGEEVTLTATPNDGYIFKEWQVISGGVTITNDKFVIGDADVEIKAVFEAVTRTITVTTDGNGTASADAASGIIGDSITLTATPNAGYQFKEWQVISGGVTITNNTFVIGTADVEIKAIFEEIPTTLEPPTPEPPTPEPPTPEPPTPEPPTPEPTTPTPTPEPSFSEFIDRLYRYALQREPEADGKAFWMDMVLNKGFTGGRCAYGFLVEAPEFLNRDLTDEQFIDTLYLIFFERAADEGGKAFWLEQFSKGMTRAEMVNGFIDSTEWCNLCASYGIKSGAPNAKAEKPSNNAIKFATRLYTECLGRDYDADGLMFWALRLTNLESSGYEAALGFFTSEEFTQKGISDDEFIHRLYRTFMGRDEDEGGFAFWKSHLGVDMTREDLVKGFAQSQEFTNICNEYGIDKGI